ncbi:hypothetical protein [Enterococcus sp. DIV1767]|uniref:hypothetical protein n=1 Tax=Enterococcus sp. DIV1767 TaxID=2774670 RepID=UPI003D2FACCC
MAKLKYNDFKNLLENRLSGYEVFMQKAEEFQIAKNKLRSGKAKWNDKKVNKAINGMWDQAAQNIYQTVKNMDKIPNSRSLDPYNDWLKFMESRNLFEVLSDSLADVEME